MGNASFHTVALFVRKVTVCSPAASHGRVVRGACARGSSGFDRVLPPHPRSKNPRDQTSRVKKVGDFPSARKQVNPLQMIMCSRDRIPRSIGNFPEIQSQRSLVCGLLDWPYTAPPPGIVWHYLSNATCLIRPHLFYVFVVVSRITIICYMIRPFEENLC